jgi:thiamine-monophosphate kinase
MLLRKKSRQVSPPRKKEKNRIQVWMKLNRLDEAELIRAIRKEFRFNQTGIALGIGDDAAVIEVEGKSLVLTKDLLLEGVHFLHKLHPPRLLGRKCLNVNLSDLAAMGALPRYALLGLGMPIGIRTGWVDDFFAGFKSSAKEYDVKLIGGDISRAQKLTLSVTLIGEGKNIIKRSGARPGHLLFVSGTLGEAREGLLLLKKGARMGEDRRVDKMLNTFLNPRAQVELGETLSRLQAASAMIDISDGLSVDLGHICEESGFGAEIERKKLPVSSELLALQKRAFDFALNGGEDYQLLFSVPAERLDAVRRIKKKYALTHIGKILKEKGIILVDSRGTRKAIRPRTWQHF